jgi:hypothetical protein
MNKPPTETDTAVWYIEPVNDHTNGCIMTNIEGVEPQKRIMCADGVRRDLLQMPNYGELMRVKHSKWGLGLSLTYYLKPSGSDAPEKAEWLHRQASTASRALRSTRQKLALQKQQRNKRLAGQPF